MEQEYKHSQTGYMLLYLVIPIILIEVVVIGVISITMDIEPAWLLPMIGGITVVTLGGCLVLFYKLTVQIKDGLVEFWFGPGLIRKKIPLDEIVSCRPVRNNWWHGWGIHRFGGGVLYNVSGLDAVEIELMSGKKLRIGTDQPEKLAEVINNTLTTDG